MGMARKAPAPIYEQHFYVSQHAVERFRGRNLKDAYRHRFGDDLSRLIDWACWEAFRPSRASDCKMPSRCIQCHTPSPARLAS